MSAWYTPVCIARLGRISDFTIPEKYSNMDVERSTSYLRYLAPHQLQCIGIMRTPSQDQHVRSMQRELSRSRRKSNSSGVVELLEGPIRRLVHTRLSYPPVLRFVLVVSITWECGSSGPYDDCPRVREAVKRSHSAIPTFMESQ